MTQKVYPDPYGVDAWDLQTRSRIFVHLVDSMTWREITGEEAPPTPVSAKTYAEHGLPWYELYDEHAPTLDPCEELAQVKSVQEIDAEKSHHPLQDDASVPVGTVKQLMGKLARQFGLRDGQW